MLHVSLKVGGGGNCYAKNCIIMFIIQYVDMMKVLPLKCDIITSGNQFVAGATPPVMDCLV